MKIFVSYSQTDVRKVEILERKFQGNKHYSLLIVANKKAAMKTLAEKVIEGIKESDIFAPILTRNSIGAQWINQEIGFARALIEAGSKMEILPLVESKVINDLKGFIHKQFDLPFHYEGNDNQRVENRAYSVLVNKLYAHLMSRISAKADVGALKSYMETNVFRFTFNAQTGRGKILAFGENGEITRGKNQNEHTWTVENGRLVIYNDKNQVFNRFEIDRETNRLKSTGDKDILALPGQFMEPMGK